MSTAATLLAFPLSRTFDLANIVMLFLLAVVGAALLFGRGPAVLAAIVNVLAFDFFFVPPRFSFAVSDAQYVFTFAVMLVVGFAVGQLTARLRLPGALRNAGRRAGAAPVRDGARAVGGARTRAGGGNRRAVRRPERRARKARC